MAEIALQDAVKQARLAAADALVAFLTAEAELQAAGRSLERATLELTRWQTLQVRGETDRLSLLRAEAQQSGARNGLAKAQLTLARARRNLAAKAGADVATQIEAGAVIDGALEEPDDAWRLPDFQPERWHRTVAETAARQSFLTQTGRYTGNGPLTVSASLDAAGIVRLGASLDLAAITGFSGRREIQFSNSKSRRDLPMPGSPTTLTRRVSWLSMASLYASCSSNRSASRPMWNSSSSSR